MSENTSLDHPNHRVRNQRIFFVVVAIALAVGMTLFFRQSGVDLSAVKTALARFTLPTLLMVFFAISVQIFCQIGRLWCLHPKGRQFSWFGVGRALTYGQAVNSFFPARAGDALKAVMLQKSVPKGTAPVSLPETIGVLLADKIIDTFSFILICLGVGGLSWFENLPGMENKTLVIVGLVLIVICGVLFLIPRIFPAVGQKIKGVLKQGYEGIRTLTRPHQSIMSFLFSTANWLAECAAVYFLCKGQGYSFGLSDIVWVLAALNIGIAVPVAVANVGAFEGAMVFALKKLGVGLAQGLAIASAHHLIQIVVIFFWAGIYALTSRFVVKTLASDAVIK